MISKRAGKQGFAIALLACGLLSLPAQAEKITIAATVNDDVITSVDLAERRALLMANAKIPDTQENQQRITPRVIQMLVDETLQMQEAKRLSITITDEDVTKAVNGLGAPTAPPGGVKHEIETHGLSVRSLNNQVRAQLAWAKVVQRKLRRNVTITQDELARAQQTQAADPGMQEMHLAVLAVAITSPEAEASALAMAKEIDGELSKGAELAAVAEKYRSKPDVQFNPQVWVSEEQTPPELFALIKDQKPGELVGPVRTGNIIQFIKMLEKRVTKKAPSSTEVLIKQISLDAPSKTDKVAVGKLADSLKTLRANPGNCDDTTLTATMVPAHAEFVRAKLGAMTSDQQNMVTRLGVGDVSEPQLSPTKVRLIMLCERSESAGAAIIDDGLRQQLFAEKIELEAQKHLRNLRREATIDIRGAQ